MSKIKKFMANGIIMTISAILVRTAAVGFNIYVAQIAGAQAIGLYAIISNIFAFAVTLALSGLHLSATRLISEALALNDKGEVSKILRRCFLYALCFGSAALCILAFITNPLAEYLLDDLRIRKPLYILCICLPSMSVSSVINGYFSAVRRVYKSSFIMVLDLIAKISATIIIFSLVSHDDPEYACIALVLANVIGEFLSFIFNLILYIHDRFRYFKSKSYEEKSGKLFLADKILSISMPIAFTSYFRSALVAIEHSLIPIGLKKYGQSHSSALASYGTLASMALPVINFPYALIGSFSSLLIPEVSESRARKEKRHLKYIAYRTYQAGIGFAICIFGFFYTFSDSLGEILYNCDDAGKFIKYLSFIVPVMYTDSITDAILKGMGEQFYSMKVNIADATISVILVYFLVPLFGINGYIATIFIAEIINATFSIMKMLKVTKLHPPILRFAIVPLLCSAGAYSICNMVSKTFLSTKNIFCLIISIIFYAIIYIAFMFTTSCISKEDAIWIKSLLTKKSDNKL